MPKCYNILANCSNFVWWYVFKEQKRSSLRLSLNGLHLGLGRKPPKGKRGRGCQLVSKYSAPLSKVTSTQLVSVRTIPTALFSRPRKSPEELVTRMLGLFSHPVWMSPEGSLGKHMLKASEPSQPRCLCGEPLTRPGPWKRWKGSFTGLRPWQCEIHLPQHHLQI